MIAKKVALFLAFLMLFATVVAQEIQPQIITVDCGGVTRYAKLYVPENVGDSKLPLIFVFHGRGGSMHGVAKNIAIHNHWPDAMVVYPQGMWCEGGYKDGFGWVIDSQSRDLEMFDALFAYLQQHYNIDLSRVYATGHSNGGAFVHALWCWRGDVFAAVAPSASTSSKLGDSRTRRDPKPVLIIGGEQDEVVRIAAIRREIAILQQINGALGVDSIIHSGDHKFPRHLVPNIVGFFKKHTLKKREIR